MSDPESNSPPEQWDVALIWYTSPATGPQWHADQSIAFAPSQIESNLERVRKRFRGKGGCETRVFYYREV